PLALDGYRSEMEAVAAAGGTPIVFPSFGLSARPDEEIVAAHAALGEACDRFLAFELGTMFSAAGRILSLDAYGGLLEVAACVGAKHSSLSREQEWQRLAVRDEIRPEFLVLTGNDLAIDMVVYGSDYLLGLSTFAPDLFARRDGYWAAQDRRFFELNDALQYLGNFCFRPPVPAYRHDAALFLHLRGWISTSRTHPTSPSRPEGDVEVLREILARLAALEPDLVRVP
ncbi:MAG: dihydrodipicolinate synthase family protein, partial [Actinomycetota bacterium]|nr:dihydrodipicolinate synthase family protein [Actinomycetota bacterium]